MSVAATTWMTGLCVALVASPLTAAGPEAISPHELLADPDRFDGQTVTVQGAIEKFREGTSREGNLFYKFRVRDGQSAVRIFGLGQLPCRNGMQVTVTGVFEKVNRMSARPSYYEVSATHVACF